MSNGISRLFKLITGAIDTLNPAKRKQRIVDEAKAVSVFNKYKPIFDKSVYDITTRLMNNEINVREWKILVVTELRYLMLTAAASGVGGIGRLSREDLENVDDSMSEQSQYLENFVTQLERSPRDSWSQPKIVTRLSQYFGSAKPVLEKSMAISNGRPKLPFQPAERTNCFGGCKCHWNWVDLDKTKGDYDVYWVMSLPAEHCETCATRARVCSPLQIRNGEIKTDLSNPKLVRDF